MWGWEIHAPLRCDIGCLSGRNGRKIVAVREKAVFSGFGGLRLVLRLSVEVDSAAPEMNVVAWDTDDALDEKDVVAIRLGYGLEEDDDVAAPDIAVMLKKGPFCRGRQRHAVDEDMVADEQRLFHGR